MAGVAARASTAVTLLAAGSIAVAAVSARISEPRINPPDGYQVIRFALYSDANDSDEDVRLWFCEDAGCIPFAPVEIREVAAGESWSPWGDPQAGEVIAYARAVVPVTPAGSPVWVELERASALGGTYRAPTMNKGERHWACANDRNADGLVGVPDIAVALSEIRTEGIAAAWRAIGAFLETCRTRYGRTP